MMKRASLAALVCVSLTATISAQSNAYRLKPHQVNLAKQAVYDGREQAAFNACKGNEACKQAMIEVIAKERVAYEARQARDRKRKAEKLAAETNAANAEGQKRADIIARAPAYMKEAVKRHAERLAQAGYTKAMLDSSYGNVTLRDYLSVLLENPNNSIYKEQNLIADVIVVLKPKDQRPTKFYFKSDYGTLTPKAVQRAYDTNMRLIALLPEREFSFASLYFLPFNQQLEAGLGY